MFHPRPLKLLQIVLAACLATGHHGLAAAASLQQDADRIDAEQIAVDPAWLALLHYRARGDGSMESEADRPHFFLSADGKRSPRAELLAAVTALYTPNGRQRLACQFPARYEWLRARLGHDGLDADADADAVELCPQLAHWLAGFPGRRISINFASSYLENPSSTFGHTFLRIFQQSGNELLSPTINYAARTDARDSDLSFVLKGLFGGFPGVADELPLYRRLRTYTEIEGRDIHEYELALTPPEVRRLLLHTWEIRDGIFDYYFVGENCAYRTLALLDVARPQAGLLKRFSLVTVPIDTVRALRSAGLLGEHRVWPSVPKQVRELEAHSTRQGALAARQVALGELAALASAKAERTLALAYEYSSVLIDRDQGERAGGKAIFGAIARARLALNHSAEPASQPLPSPEEGHDGALLAAGIRRRGGQNAVSLEYAAFQHTLTNPLPGYEPHADISVLNGELLVQRGQVRLRRIDWLVAQSTIPSSTLFGSRAWRLHLVTRSEPFAAREHMTTSLAYHAGKAWLLGADTVFAVLPGVSVQAGSGLAHDAGLAGALRAALTRQGPSLSAQLELRAEKFFAGSTLPRHSAHATGELRLARNLSLAIGASRDWAPQHRRELHVTVKWRHRSLGGGADL